MAHASRNARKIRRLKRERTLALRMLELALGQRDTARGMVNALLKNIPEKPEPTLTIEKVEEPEEAVNEG